MQVAVIAVFIFVYALVVAVSWRSAKEADHLAGRVDTVTKIGESGADPNELNKPFAERFLKPMTEGFIQWLSGRMPKTENPRLAATLKQAGLQSTTREYSAKRLVTSLVAGLAIGLALMLMTPQGFPAIALEASGSTLGFFFLDGYSLKSRIKKRKLLIQKQLPEVLDLLSVSVEAGLGFDASLQRITSRTQGPLVDELNTTYREITLGRPRAEALRNFEQRCGLEEIKSFVSSIIQAEQLGISLKNVLKSQAQQMRLIKRQKVEEKAMKAPVKIIIPLVFFVFPVMFIILLGPAIIQIAGMQGLFG